MDNSFYRFPAMAKLKEFTEPDQLKHLQSEATEAVMQYARWYTSGTKLGFLSFKDHENEVKKERKAYGMELMDVIHSAETALRQVFTDEEVAELRDAVEKNNRDRGYYGEYE